MKQNLGRIVFSTLLFLAASGSIAQKTSPILPLTADSLASGNYKDVFKSFFQLAFDRFTGNNKELQFSSNPFAIMAKMDPSLLNRANYVRYTHLRNLNFSFSGKLDSAYHFNGFSSGVKYALINHRDETVSNAFVIMAVHADEEYRKLNDSLLAYATDSKFPLNEKIKLNNQRDSFINGKISLSKLNTGLQAKIREVSPKIFGDLKANAELTIPELESKLYDSLRTHFHERSLWTVGISDTTYKNQFFFSNIVLSTEFLKGLDDPTKPLKPVGVQLNLKAAINSLDDSLRAGRDLRRSIFQFEPGFNFVFRAKKALYSYAEFKVSGSYYHNLSNLYASEKRDSLTLNGTLRLRIFNDIWVPLEIKYDPKSGNIFGFLNVRANFSSLKSLVSNK